MKKFLNLLFSHKKIIGFFILLCLYLLKFYQLHDFVVFLGDQGRDAIIMKRIITLEKFTLIGPPTSIGNVFLGPIFYYLHAPWLGVAKFDPIGPVWGGIFYQGLLLISIYIILKKYFSNRILFIFGMLLLTNKTLFESSRFAWNPNLLPYVSFLMLVVHAYGINQKLQKYKYLLLGCIWGIALQLHYLALLIYFPFLIEDIILHWKDLRQKKIKKFCIQQLTFFLGTVILLLPLLLFDLRHQFINSKAFITAILTPSMVETSFFDQLQSVFRGYFSHVFLLSATPVFLQFFIIAILLALLFVFKKGNNNQFLIVRPILLTILLYAIFFAKLNTQKPFHYFAPLYLPSYFLIALIIHKFIQLGKYRLLPIILFLGILVNFSKNLSIFSTHSANHQIEEAKLKAQIIMPHINHHTYQLAATPFSATLGHIRYFLDFQKNRPLDEDSSQNGEELFVYCFEPTCSIDGNGAWFIASYQTKPNKISYLDSYLDVQVFHLTRP